MSTWLKRPLLNLRNLASESRTKMRPGVQGNFQTVDLMRRMAHKRKGHPKVRKLTENILKQYKTKSQHFYDEAWAIGTWVHGVFPYLRDPKGIESVQDPLTMIDKLSRDEVAGDCDDMSLLIATMLLSVGHQPFYAIVRYPNMTTGFQHIYVVTYERNYRGKPKRLVLDAIVKDQAIGYEVPSILKKEIKV